MAGGVEERGRPDSVAEAIEQTFIKLDAGGAAEQKRDSQISQKAPARPEPRERRRGGTTRLDLAEVLGSNEAAARMRSRIAGVEPDHQRPAPSSETSARRTPRERRKGGTTRLDLEEVLGSREAAAQMRNRIASLQPASQLKGSTSDRSQRSPAAESTATSRAHVGRRPKGVELESTPPDSEAALPPAADTSRAPLTAALSEAASGARAGQVVLTRVDMQDRTKLASMSARYPEVNIFDSGT